MSIFKDNAPKYWAVGLPVMPLRPNSKIPFLTSWQSYSTQMPSEDEQARWLDAYPDGNMGLPLGPQSGVVALDIDTDDQRVQAILDRVMPPTPWRRVGKKGAVYVFKYNGERIYRIKDEDGNTILELLSKGSQIVLPPSIHPDTGRAYEANAKLHDVIDQMVALPADFETTIRRELINAGYKLTTKGSAKLTEWVPSGGRDSALTSICGLTARSVTRGERSLLEALNEVEVWVATYTERVVGDTMDPGKARSKVMEFVRRDVVEHGRSLPQGWDDGMLPEEVLEARAFFGEDAEAWSYERIVAHLTDKFTEFGPDNTSMRAKIIEECLLRVAKSTDVSETQTEMFLQFVVNASGRLINLSALRKQLRVFKGAEIAGEDHTELAQLLIQELERYGEVRFATGSFYQWRGSHFAQLAEHEVLKVLAESFGGLPAARRQSDHRGIFKVASTLVPQELVEVDVKGINFANGFLTTDLELRDHDPRYGATYCLPYRYVPEQGSPMRFLSLLDQCWGKDPDHAEKVQALREAISATLFGVAARFSRAICLYGMPRSGKSTVTDIVMGLVPDEGRCSVPPHDWADRFMPTMMAGKLVNHCGELSERFAIAGDRFKSIVEGAEMMGQHKGAQIFKFRPLCAHWFASNHLPKTRDTSEGFNRRWLFLQFLHQVPLGELVQGLAEDILFEEREQIAAWAAGTIVDLMRQQDYTMPASHLRVMSETASQNNSVRFFMVSGEIESRDGAQIEERMLYSRYFLFAKTVANTQPVALKNFRQMMMELQTELKFAINITQVPGGEEVQYVGLTPARRRNAA